MPLCSTFKLRVSEPGSKVRYSTNLLTYSLLEYIVLLPEILSHMEFRFSYVSQMSHYDVAYRNEFMVNLVSYICVYGVLM